MDTLEERRQKLFSRLKDKNYIIYIILAFIIWIGFKMRINNLPLLKDVTTGKYIPIALDPYVFLRYAKTIVEQGSLPAIDFMRNFPVGFPLTIETPLLQYFVAYLFKIMRLFNPDITVEFVHVIYPPIAFAIGLIFFFLLVRNLFDNRTGLLSTAFLAVIPTFLYRTMSGFSDKEALGTTLMFMALFFFVKALKSKDTKNNITFGALAGISTGLMGLVWGGVSFLFLTFGAFVLLEIFLGKFTENDFFTYTTMFILMIPILVSARFSLANLFVDFASGIMFVAFFMTLIDYFFIKKNMLSIRSKLEGKIPTGIMSFLIAIVLVTIIATIFVDPNFIVSKPAGLIEDLIFPLKDRWALTVAESHEPYITDWIGNLGWKYVLMFIAGSIFMFYEVVKPIKEHKGKLTILYIIFILAFIFSRYKRESILNGVTPLSKFMYIGSLIIFALIITGLYIYTFYKKKEVFAEIKNLNRINILVLVWFLVMIIGARRAVRLIFIFSPITCVLVGFLLFKLFDLSKDIKKDSFRIAAWIALAFILISPISIAGSSLFGITDQGSLYKFYVSSESQSHNMGPGYNKQWQVAMNWVRENTPEDAVFAHWWDYGYWVQTGGQRATIADGGNAIGVWNHFMGRHVLTGQSDIEALRFLYAHNATHLLIIHDEIGKYPAFSSIGSDANYDRYSWITTFNLDTSAIRETRNMTTYLYKGGHPFAQDVIYQDTLLPRQAAGIGAFSMGIVEQDGKIGFSDPTAIVVYNGRQFNIPLQCIFFNNQEIRINEEGLPGCLMIIPKIDNSQMNPIGAALWLSEDVYKGRMGQYYLLNKKSPYFELVYDDSSSLALAVYNGRLVGPLKIWKIHYPEDIEFDPYYLVQDFPDYSVTKI